MVPQYPEEDDFDEIEDKDQLPEDSDNTLETT